MLFSLHCVTSLLTQALLDTTRLWLPLELLMGWRIYTGAHHSQWSSTRVSLVFHVREVITLLLNVKVFQTLVAIKPDYYGGAWCFFFFLLTPIKKKNVIFSFPAAPLWRSPLSLLCVLSVPYWSEIQGLRIEVVCRAADAISTFFKLFTFVSTNLINT